MPVHRASDHIGSYYQWGHRGKKYYYQAGSPVSRSIAKDKAARQGRAIAARRYR